MQLAVAGKVIVVPAPDVYSTAFWSKCPAPQVMLIGEAAPEPDPAAVDAGGKYMYPAARPGVITTGAACVISDATTSDAAAHRRPMPDHHLDKLRWNFIAFAFEENPFSEGPAF